jgi:hypothetical protein
MRPETPAEVDLYERIIDLQKQKNNQKIYRVRGADNSVGTRILRIVRNFFLRKSGSGG